MKPKKIFTYEFSLCGRFFKMIISVSAEEMQPSSPNFRSMGNRKLIGASDIHVRRKNRTTDRIEKRIQNYLNAGKLIGVTRFADKAASKVKSEKIKRIAEKLYQKSAKGRESLSS